MKNFRLRLYRIEFFIISINRQDFCIVLIKHSSRLNSLKVKMKLFSRLKPIRLFHSRNA